MKTWLANKAGKVLVLGLASGLGFFAFTGRADLEVSGSLRIQATAEFDAPLAPYGTWVEVNSYGRCWRPSRIAVEWRPYCYGQWVWTDCGWYWASDEPWGWACYQYGYWVDAPGYGWIWIPGVEWAPAWVCWRVGGGYIGWAPLASAAWGGGRRAAVRVRGDGQVHRPFGAAGRHLQQPAHLSADDHDKQYQAGNKEFRRRSA